MPIDYELLHSLDKKQGTQPSPQIDTTKNLDSWLNNRKQRWGSSDPTSEFTPEKVDDRIGGILGGLADLVEGGFNSLEPTSANVIATGLEGVNQFASDPIGTVNKLTVGSALRLGGMIGDAVTNGNGYEKMDKWLSENTERGVKLFDPNTSILRDASEGWRQHSKQYSEKNPIPDSFMGELGAGGTSFSMTVVPTVITALATKNPATVAKVAQSLGYALETSSQYQDLLDSGYKPEEAMTGAHTYGIMASILEKQVPEKIAGGLTKDFLKKGYKKLFKEMAERGTLEGFTEVTQDILATSLKWNKMDDKQKEEYLKGLPSQAARTFAVSFILGVAGGLPGDVNQIRNEKSQNKLEKEFGTGEEITTETVIEPEQIAKPEVEEVKLTPEQQLKKVRKDAISAEYKATIKNIDDSKAEIRREVNRLNGELKIAKNDNEIIDEKRISGELAKLKEQLKSLDSQRKTAKEDAIKKIDEVENLKENEPTEVKLLNARKTSPELPSNASKPNYRTQPLTVEERYDATNEMKLADKIKNLRVKINDPKVKNKKELKAELKRAILQLNEISRAKANKQLNETNFEQQTADLQKLTPTEATEPQTPAKGMEVKAEVKEPVKEETKIKGAVKENLTTEQPKQKSMVDVHNEALKLHKSSYGLKDKNKLQRLLSAKAIMDEAGYDRKSELYTENDRLINNIKQTLGIKTNETSLPVKEAVRNIEETKYEMRKSKGGWSVDKKENNNWGFVQQFRTKKEAQNYIDSKQKPEVSNVKEKGETLLEEKPKTNKEPWEMTNKEVLESIRTKPTLSGNNNSLIGLGKNILTSGMTIEGIPANEIPGWEDVLLNHKKAVQQALSEGKPVPPEVLKEYPDLQTSSPVKETVKAEPVNQPLSEQPRVEAEKKPVNKPVSETKPVNQPSNLPSKDRTVEPTGDTGTDAPVSKRVFSEEGYKKDRKDASDILNRPNFIGAQLEAVPQMLRIAGYHLENVVRAGVEKGRQFTEWTKSMIKDLGGKIRPYLKKIWEETQRQFGKKLLQYAEKNPFIRSMNVVEGSLFTNDNLPPVQKYTDKDLEVLFEKNPVVRKKVSEFTKKTKETADDILRPMSAEIEQIDKDTYTAIKENDFETLAETNRRIKQITPFLEKFVRFRKYQPKEFAKLSYYLTANNMVEAEKIMSKWKMSEAFKPVRDTLNELYVEGVKVKYDLGYLKDYFPRDMVDYEGYLKEIRGKKAFDVFQELIDKKNAERKKKGEAVLTTDEENKLITNAIRGYNPGISLSGIANYKERVIKAFPPSYAKYYDTAENALINYIVKATDAIQQRKLFGYGVDAEASIASYIKGKGLDAEKSAKLKRILKARYNFMSNKWASQVRGIMYFTTLNNPTSSIKNLADVPMALYNSGSLTKTFVALGRALVNKSVIKMEDAGLHNMGGEYMNLSSRNKATNAMMKWMLAFPYFDKVGKETYINATMSKYYKLANSNPDKLKTKLGKWFNEERASQVVSDLRQKKSYKDIGKTNLLNLVAYLEISDVQPTTMTEMPLKYAESPNGRVLYTMKSFQLKRLDFFRKETLHKIRTKGQRLEGMRNLAMLTTMIGLGEAGTEQIISWLLGRDESFTEQIADSMLSIIGFNRYDVEKAKRTNPIDVIFNKALPIATPLKDLWDDYETAADNYELTRYLTTHKTDRPFKAKSLNALPWVRTIRKNIENR